MDKSLIERVKHMVRCPRCYSQALTYESRKAIAYCTSCDWEGKPVDTLLAHEQARPANHWGQPDEGQ